ncbi:hypothetical protein BpHYR1_004732 [Brachionus plicatilis]|uniref:Uncharacterized protein n=1 Tax=Brachionus plicatilis TaxID=10195 RepID=A0A3M7P435_BRAPC|nr:hypothetical protein BpHYR1_004732 [Brachionus plicatilis]
MDRQLFSKVLDVVITSFEIVCYLTMGIDRQILFSKVLDVVITSFEIVKNNIAVFFK